MKREFILFKFKGLENEKLNKQIAGKIEEMIRGKYDCSIKAIPSDVFSLIMTHEIDNRSYELFKTSLIMYYFQLAQSMSKEL